MLSGRFNKPEIVEYIKNVKKVLDEEDIPTFMVDAAHGEEFARPTMYGLYHAKAMAVFGTDAYGARTAVGYETYYELEYAHQHGLHLIPLKLCNKWPPEPKDHDGGEKGKIQNHFILGRTRIYIEDVQMTNPKETAKKIAKAVRTVDGVDPEADVACCCVVRRRSMCLGKCIGSICINKET